MTLTDVLMVLSTALSPLIAVQVTRWLDDLNEERGRKLQVFKILMATRAYSVSPQHVEALNRIDLEFSPKRPAEKAVLDVWQQYLDHLGQTKMEAQAWNIRRVDLLVELLHAMGKAVGYDFNKTQIKNGTYSPTAHGRLESEQERLRTLTLELLEGKRLLPTFVANLNPLPEGAASVKPTEGSQQAATKRAES
ncbi:MAG TPA: DUF6680 family protein [Ramlibacter sp.]|uniref:DUF6680 family protein n=1 Tax=Ramlibacter sp. TaxID=1917967 RepID=UPI002BCF9181|nr:DUF6680 family protein [Ramlibacter sp.]HVZ47068.1 DUF6680 family protein [Ramlibacter sp.]